MTRMSGLFFILAVVFLVMAIVDRNWWYGVSAIVLLIIGVNQLKRK